MRIAKRYKELDSGLRTAGMTNVGTAGMTNVGTAGMTNVGTAGMTNVGTAGMTLLIFRHSCGGRNPESVN